MDKTELGIELNRQNEREELLQDMYLV